MRTRYESYANSMRAISMQTMGELYADYQYADYQYADSMRTRYEFYASYKYGEH